MIISEGVVVPNSEAYRKATSTKKNGWIKSWTSPYMEDGSVETVYECLEYLCVALLAAKCKRNLIEQKRKRWRLEMPSRRDHGCDLIDCVIVKVCANAVIGDAKLCRAKKYEWICIARWRRRNPRTCCRKTTDLRSGKSKLAKRVTIPDILKRSFPPDRTAEVNKIFACVIVYIDLRRPECCKKLRFVKIIPSVTFKISIITALLDRNPILTKATLERSARLSVP